MDSFNKAVKNATQNMRTMFPETPLQRNDHLSKIYGADVFLKREDLSPVRSYKIRGAFNALAKVLSTNADQNLFVCASAGNHAQGMAFVCRHFGVKGVIYMPVTTPQQKIEKTKIFGGDAIEVVLEGDYFDETLAAAQSYCEMHNGHFLSPFDDPDVIEGQATVVHEALQQMQTVPDVIVLPVGGGGLSSGTVKYLRTAKSTPKLVFVEPSGGASLKAAVDAGHLITLESVDNFVDGASVARIGEHPFEILKSVDSSDVLSIKEDRVCTTITEMLNVEGIVLEPAGALSVDALKDLKDEIEGKSVLCITSGGNFDFERLPEVKERAQRHLGVKKYFILRLPQRPGALKEFLSMLGPDDDIARFEYLKKSARNFGSVLIGIETKKPENFQKLFKKLDAAGFVFDDITENETLVNFVI